MNRNIPGVRYVGIFILWVFLRAKVTTHTHTKSDHRILCSYFRDAQPFILGALTYMFFTA